MINLSRLKNIYKKTNIQSEIISQILYGEKFLILKRYKDWLKIKTIYDTWTFSRDMRSNNPNWLLVNTLN